MLKRLSSIEIRTVQTLARKYEFSYINPSLSTGNARSLLSSITLKDRYDQGLPPTTFSYQMIDKQPTGERGFGVETQWPNPSVWKAGGITFGNYIRDNKVTYGIIADVIDIDGDGVVERVR